MDAFLVFVFICVLKGSFGDFYVNVTHTVCLSIAYETTQALEPISISKDSSLVFQALYKGSDSDDQLLIVGNFSRRIANYKRNSQQFNVSFCIVNTTIYDGGDYYNSAYPTNREKLYVLAKPTKPLMNVLKDGIIKSNNGEISCMSESTSAPQGLRVAYSWFVNDTIIKSGNKYKCNANNGCNVLIITVERNDRFNNYTCSATEQFGQTSENSDIKKIDPIRLPTVMVSPADNPFKVVENTTNFKLTCNAINAYPEVTSYKWYKDGYVISSTAIYTVTIVNRSDTGSYKCGATNQAGSSNSSSLQLNILYGIEIIPITRRQPIEGTNLNITCFGQSYPAFTDSDVIWTKMNDEGSTKKGRHLVIDEITRMQSGTYVCSVFMQLTPSFGHIVNISGTTTVEVDVLYLPTVKISPSISPFNVVENTTNFNMTCNVTDANPNVTSYKWYKDGFVISSTAKYTIAVVNRSHTGSYICGATNKAGSSNSTSLMKINVLYGVEINSISLRQPLEGTALNITCSGKSYPSITGDDVSWTKLDNKGFFEKGQHLVFENIKRHQSGTYVCSVVIQLTPSSGQPVNLTGNTNAEVDVLYKPTVIVSPHFNPNTVKENNTDIRMICNVTDANPPENSYRWNKDGSKISSLATYIISTVNRSHSGSYTCNATNTVGSSDPSSVFQLNVLYGVSLKFSQTEINVNESEMWDLSCIGDGNPIPTITCANKYNSSAVGEHTYNETSISVDHANCIDTGLYTCSGNNSIGEPVSKSADIKVACKPRTYNNLVKQDIYINGTDDSLYISTTFISYPLSVFTWYRALPNGNLTELNKEFNTSIMHSNLPYEQVSFLQKDILEPNEFGIYLLEASNIHGSFLLTYDVIPKKKPDPPTNITASCDITSIRVSWISRFNGGENQTFRILFVNNLSNQTSYKDDIADEGEDKTIKEEKELLSPGALYSIFVEAYNVHGGAQSKEVANCTTKISPVGNQPVSSALVGGIAGSISALLIVVIIIGVLYFWHRRQVNGGHKKLIRRHSKENDEDEEGLKTNPLYVTSGEVLNAEVGPVYGVVNKKRQKKETMTLDENTDQGPVYSQVQKPSTKKKKKGKETKIKKTSRNENYKDIELGTVYENSDKVSKLNTNDELYGNAGEPGKGVNLAKGYIPKKNKDGLIYADLDLVSGPNGGKFVIRGIENKTNYAMIDLSIKVDPLPSDDDEEDKDIEKAKSAANDYNE